MIFVRLRKTILNKLIIILLCISTCFLDAKPYDYVIWIASMEHHVDFTPKTQVQWGFYFKNSNIINGAFFLPSNKPISPYYSINGIVSIKNNRKWWAVDQSNECGFELKSPDENISIHKQFVISVCPPLIHNGNDVSRRVLNNYGSSTFLKRNCSRTLIGKTYDGNVFISVITGNLYTVRDKLRQIVPNIKWLANLDGGSSSFLTIDGIRLVCNKTKVPSIILFEYNRIYKF